MKKKTTLGWVMEFAGDAQKVIHSFRCSCGL